MQTNIVDKRTNRNDRRSRLNTLISRIVSEIRNINGHGSRQSVFTQHTHTRTHGPIDDGVHGSAPGELVRTDWRRGGDKWNRIKYRLGLCRIMSLLLFLCRLPHINIYIYIYRVVHKMQYTHTLVQF